MVFPDPTGVISRAQAIASVASTPRWRSVAFDHRRVLFASRHAAVLVYKASAERDSPGTTYAAWCSSLDVEADGAGHLAMHQQAPDPD